MILLLTIRADVTFHICFNIKACRINFNFADSAVVLTLLILYQNE